jgi:ATP-binding cassette subfamily B protein
MNIRHNKRNEINDKKFKNIKLNNVSFIYPNTNKKAVNNINIEINKGDKIALVGENGSGKSTLIKLMLGLYTPTEGNVIYNGEKSKGIDKKDLYSDKSVVFQDFNRYFMSVYENVLMGNYCENNRQEIVQSLIKSGFPLNKFSLEDNLGREFGGIELSGGEWQKLSIARGFFKRSEMIVFDEPTSAIDPFQESKLYEKFFELFSKKTMLLVTHRLGAIKLVDKIIVLNDGKIIETGTHEELINRDGYYNKLWSSQTKWYDLNYDS